MARFASLSSSTDRVKRKLQAALFYARKKNRELRKEEPEPEPPEEPEEEG